MKRPRLRSIRTATSPRPRSSDRACQGPVRIAVVALVSFLSSLASCGTVGPYPIVHSNENPVPAPVTRPMLLEPGTTVAVKFLYTPEMDEEQIVTPDGKISLQLVGEVDVGSKSTREVHDELVERYSRWLVDPEIVVIVRAAPSRRILVGGLVNTPGVYEMPGNLTALEAVFLAGGYDPAQGDMSQVVVIRQTEDQRHGYIIDLEPSLAGQNGAPFFLQPMDMVFVPQSGIAAVNQWIDQHINQMIPDIGFFLRYPLSNGGTIGWGTNR